MKTRFGTLVCLILFSIVSFIAFPVLGNVPSLFAEEVIDDGYAPDSDVVGGLDGTEEEESVASYFSNPAQAAHAANLAEQAALRDDKQIQSALAGVEEAEQTLKEAEQALDKVQVENPDDIATFETAFEAAEKQLEQAKEAYATTLSNVSGVTTKDIMDMRDSGLGWGNISHELGLHPGLLGLGKTKGKQKHYAGPVGVQEDVVAAMTQNELEEATARDTKSGWSKGHGFGVKSGVHATGNESNSFASFSSSQGKGKGKGGSKGDNGNRGGGYSGAGGLGGQGSSNSNDMGEGSSRGGYGKSSNSNKGSANNSGPSGNSNKGGNSSKGNKGGNKGGNSGKGKK